MIALLAVLCLAGTPGIQGKTLLEQIVPHPTGNNGYEEYLRAADIVSGADMMFWWLDRTTEWQDMPFSPKTNELAKRLKTMSALQIRREVLERLGKALELVRQGNAKPVYEPRPSIALGTYFLELGRFKELARLAVYAAYVYDADGASSKGTDVLLDTLVMADNIAPGPMLHFLTGSMIQRIVLSGFESRLNRLSFADASRVAAFVSNRLDRTPVVLGAVRDDSKFLLGIVGEMLTKPKDATAALLSNEAGGVVAGLPPAERAELVARIRAKLEAYVASVVLRLQGPESGWVFEDPEVSEVERGNSVGEVADMFFEIIVQIDGHGRPSTSAARLRAQLRLLRLAARVIAFRWQHERLPPTLEDAAPAKEIADPLTGDKFQYTPMGETFRVFSKGVKATGEIDIRYRRAVGGGGPPPP